VTQSKYREPKGDIDLSKHATLKNLYWICAFIAIVGANFRDSTSDSVIFTIVGFGFIVAANRMKDIDKAKAKERDLTETRIRLEMARDFEKSLGPRHDFVREHITKTVEQVMGQVAIAVKDISPTRAAELRIVNEGDETK
jgi:DNA-directed RNA polymerase subunit F